MENIVYIQTCLRISKKADPSHKSERNEINYMYLKLLRIEDFLIEENIIEVFSFFIQVESSATYIEETSYESKPKNKICTW